MAEAFAAMVEPGLFEQPRYNIAPMQEVPVVAVLREGQGGEQAGQRRQVRLMRWGLIPSWAEDVSIGNRMINARAESVAQKPAFRAAYARRRCLVPADGFYEWQRTGGGKQPFYMQIGEGELFAFAGLWERWRRDDADVVESFTIITTDADAQLRDIHDRMPVIVSPADWRTWLDPAADPASLQRLLRPWHGPLSRTPVTQHVNSPRHDDPHCIDPLLW